MFSGITSPMICLDAEIGKSVTNRSDRGFAGKPESLIRTHETVGHVDLAELFQIFETREADIFAGAFENTGAPPKSVFPVIGYRMLHQDFSRLFDIGESCMGTNHEHRIAVQSEERFSVIFDIFPSDQSLGLDNHLHSTFFNHE